jgi:hypothetical protein
MAAACAEALGLRRSFVTVPISPAIVLLEILRRMNVKAPGPDVLRRFSENPEFSTQEMTSSLGVVPRPFEAGTKLAMRGWENRKSEQVPND